MKKLTKVQRAQAEKLAAKANARALKSLEAFTKAVRKYLG